MKILVTGALGHIGSALIRNIAEWHPDPEVIMVDNFSAQRYCSLFDLPRNARYKLIEADVHSYDLAKELDGVDLVVHLAAITNAAGSFEIREKLERENFNATKLVVDACSAAGTKVIVLSSTSVYGTSKSLVDESCSEEDLQPQSPYAETKLREENYVRDLCRKAGLRAVVFRFGTIFGVSPGMRFHTAVNKFCFQAVTGQPITVWRTAMDQVRPYLDLADGVRAIRHAFTNDIFDGEVYNVLTLNASPKKIIDLIERKWGAVKVDLVDAKIMNQLSYEVSYEKFGHKGFQPSGDLAKGIQETLGLFAALNRSK